MATKKNPGEFDCYANAELDEPMFVLLARDPLAPFLVRAWSYLRRGDLVGAMTEIDNAWPAIRDSKKKTELDKLIEAWNCSDAMQQWQLGLKWAAELDAARTYKVFDVDNLGRDYQTEYLIEGTEGLSKEQAEQVAKWLNSKRPYGGEFSDRYCTVVNNERKPYVFEGY